jgi:hypothetical protein
MKSLILVLPFNEQLIEKDQVQGLPWPPNWIHLGVVGLIVCEPQTLEIYTTV